MDTYEKNSQVDRSCGRRNLLDKGIVWVQSVAPQVQQTRANEYLKIDDVQDELSVPADVPAAKCSYRSAGQRVCSKADRVMFPQVDQGA